MKNKHKVIIPFYIGYEKHEEIFHMLITYDCNELKTMQDILKYIHSLENTFINEKLNFKIKDICNYNTDFTNAHMKTINLLGFDIENIYEAKERFQAWIYFMHLFCDKNIIDFNEIYYFNCKFRPEGNY